jgi:hypothetical protein
MHFTFIRPHLEHASEVWEGRTCQETDLLEKVQLHVARIVTGLPKISSKESLYLETGWEPLSSRRKSIKLTTMFKVYNNLDPTYLKQLFPSTRGNLSRFDHKKADISIKTMSVWMQSDCIFFK